MMLELGALTLRRYPYPKIYRRCPDLKACLGQKVTDHGGSSTWKLAEQSAGLLRIAERGGNAYRLELPESIHYSRGSR
jgi:hypothetical protein